MFGKPLSTGASLLPKRAFSTSFWCSTCQTQNQAFVERVAHITALSLSNLIPILCGGLSAMAPSNAGREEELCVLSRYVTWLTRPASLARFERFTLHRQYYGHVAYSGEISPNPVRIVWLRRGEKGLPSKNRSVSLMRQASGTTSRQSHWPRITRFWAKRTRLSTGWKKPTKKTLRVCLT